MKSLAGIILISSLFFLQAESGLFGWRKKAATTTSTTSTTTTTEVTAEESLCEEHTYNTAEGTSEYSTGPKPYCGVTGDDLYKGQYVYRTKKRDNLLPSWANLTLAAIGQKFANDNFFYFIYSTFMGLIFGLGELDFTNVLLYTNSSNTPNKALKRYLATTVQLMLWYEVDLKNETECNVFLTSIQNVRNHHEKAANSANKFLSDHPGQPLVTEDEFDYLNDLIETDVWDAVMKDLKNTTFPTKFPQAYLDSQYGDNFAKVKAINMYIQGMATIGFMGAAALYPDAFYISGTDEQWTGFYHFWAIVQYALGVDDQYNICLKPNIQLVRQGFIDYLNDFGFPAFLNINNNAKISIEATIKGMAEVVFILPFTNLKLAFLKGWEDIFGLDVSNLKALIDPIEMLHYEAFENGLEITKNDLVVRASLSEGMKAAVRGLVPVNFGVLLTNMQLAENAFYTYNNETDSK